MLTCGFTRQLQRWFRTSISRSMGQISAASAAIETKDPNMVLSNPLLSYQDIFFSLHQQACNSMLLHVNGNPTVDQIYLEDQLNIFCGHYGNVLYLRSVKSSPNYFIVEFSSPSGIDSLSNACAEGSLNLRMADLSPKGLNLSNMPNEDNSAVVKNDLAKRLRNAADVSEQINIYFETKRASSDHVRNNLFLCSLFQDFFNFHMNCDVTAVPYGTTVFGFSSPTSDVDVSLSRVAVASEGGRRLNAAISSFHQIPLKAAALYRVLHRTGANKFFKAACYHMNKHFPGVTNLSSHDAVNPLIKLHFLPLKANADICLENRVGVQMGWMINMFARIDSRVAPLLFLIRAWSNQCGITRHGGIDYTGMTPFMMTCLGLFYLMRIKPPVLPPIKKIFRSKPSPDDIVLGGFRTKLHNDILAYRSNNTDTLTDLFLGFFDYYRSFRFREQGVCLRTGSPFPTGTSGLNISIPLMSDNVGRVCPMKSVTQFQNEAEKLLRKLEGKMNKRSTNWGIMCILEDAS